MRKSEKIMQIMGCIGTKDNGYSFLYTDSVFKDGIEYAMHESTGYSHSEFIPTNSKNAAQEQLQQILDACKKADGINALAVAYANGHVEFISEYKD